MEASFAFPAFSIALAIKGICCAIEWYKIKKELKANEKSCESIRLRIQVILGPMAQIEPCNQKELNSLLLRHAMLKDEQGLLKAEASRQKNRMTLFFGLSVVLALAALASLAFPPLAGSILMSIALIAIGLCVIPAMRDMRARQKQKNECLTNIAHVRGSGRAKSGTADHDMEGQLKFKSSLHQVDYIQQNYPVPHWKGALMERIEVQLCGEHQSIQLAFNANAKQLNAHLALLKDFFNGEQTAELMNEIDLREFKGAIQQIANQMIDMKAMQHIAPDLILPRLEYGDLMVKMLNSLSLNAFFKGSKAEPDVKKFLSYWGGALYQGNNESEAKEAGEQCVKKYKTIEKRTNRAHCSFTFFSLLSAQTRKDRQAVQKAKKRALLEGDFEPLVG